MNLSRTLARTLQLALACALLITGSPTHAAEVGLLRLDCGNEPQPASVASFSDTDAYPDLKLPFTYSCYLIRHGDRYLLWDTGNAMDGAPEAPKTALVELIKQAGVPLEKIEYVGISHHHLDHTGQLPSFKDATLLVGHGDWEMMSATTPPAGMDAKDFAMRRARFAPWMSGGGKVFPLTADRKDVFGDGTVVMISLPGHTPGHHGLLVKLEKMGNVLLSGDVTHFHENYDSNGIPRWNSNRADSLASLDRFKTLAANLKATVIIQHDPRDIGKLPAFPAFAE